MNISDDVKKITAVELSEVLNITKRAVNLMLSQEDLNIRFEMGTNNQKLYYIDSLPLEIQEKITRFLNGFDEDSIENIAIKYEIKVPSWKLKQPKIADKVKMVSMCLAVPEGAPVRKARIKEIAESYGYNVGTAYRDIEKVKKGKWLVKPSKNYGEKIGPDSLDITVRAWDKEAAEIAINEIMLNKRNHAEKLTLYERVCEQAESQGLTVGSYDSFLDIHNKISPSMLKFRDMGIRGLREDIVPAIRRDHTAYTAMECLIGDQHKADYYCYDYNGNVINLELFVWLDFRSQMAFGAIAYKHYNRYTVGQALLNAVRFGMPKQVYTDWGKPEESNYVNQLVKQLSELGIETRDIRRTRAKVRHPQAKPIEPWFGRYDKKLKNRNIPGYCKRLNDSRENEMQQEELKEIIRAGKLLYVEDMVEQIFDEIERWNDHKFKNRGVDNGKSPREIYYEETGKFPVSTLSSDVLDYIFLPEIVANGNGKPVTIKRSQVKIKHEFFKRTITYYSPEFADHNGKEISIRYNPFDPSMIWVFDRFSHKLISTASEWSMINPKNTDQVSERIAMQERLIRLVRTKYILWTPKRQASKVRKIHSMEREARQFTKSKEQSKNNNQQARIMRTAWDEEIDLETGEVLEVAEAVQVGSGYRPLVFERKNENIKRNHGFFRQDD